MYKIKSIFISVLLLSFVFGGCSFTKDKRRLTNEISELKEKKSQAVQLNSELEELTKKNLKIKSLTNDINTQKRELEIAKDSLEREARDVLQ